MMVSVKVSSGGSCTGDGRPQEDSLENKGYLMFKINLVADTRGGNTGVRW